jgi:hypothetical protein
MFARNATPIVASTVSQIDHDHSLRALKSHHDYLLNLVYPTVSNRIDEVRYKAMKDFKISKRIIEHPFPLGSIVMIYNSDRKAKTDPLYLGPGTVTHVNRNQSYSIRLNSNEVIHKVPVSHLKLISRVPLSNPRMPTSFAQADAPSFKVKSILTHNHIGDSIDYLVQWSDSSLPSSWVNANDFDDPKLVSSYWKSLNQTRSAQPKLTIKFKNPNFHSRGGRCDKTREQDHGVKFD